MQKNIKSILFLAQAFVMFIMLIMLATSCAKQVSPTGGDEKLPIDGEIFDLSTKTKSVLKVKYEVPQDYKVYFEVYSQNPEELDVNGQIVKKAIKPIDAGFTDGKGEYSYNITVPAGVDKLYIYSPYAGVPNVMVAKVVRDGISEAKLIDHESTKYQQSFAANNDAAYNKIKGDISRLGFWINSKGEYSLNESVVGYNIKNEVIETKDKYTVLSSVVGNNNSFAYQLDAQKNEVEVSVVSSLGGDGGAYLDTKLDKATVRLANNILSYVNLPTKATFEVATKYTGRRISKDDFTSPPYNPFITTTKPEIEVHLTNKRPTDAIDKNLLGTKDDYSKPSSNLYYIAFDKGKVQMPFSNDIFFEDAESANNFIVPAEGKHIYDQYPKFMNWV